MGLPLSWSPAARRHRGQCHCGARVGDPDWSAV